MSRHEGSVRLRHMLDHSREVMEMTRGKTRHDLDTDRKLNLCLKSLGRRRAEPPWRIPWAQIAALRNRLVHGYDSVDFDVLWHIIAGDLPP